MNIHKMLNINKTFYNFESAINIYIEDVEKSTISILDMNDLS